MDVPILIAAYYFPPTGGAGTQRFAKFCKFLPAHGLRPVVVTRASDEQRGAAFQEDASLDSGEGGDVRRVPGGGSPVLGRAARAAGFYLDEETWVRAAIPEAFRLCETHRPRAVVTTTPPYAVYHLGRSVSARFGIPWVLDLRDPWTLDAWRVFRSPLHLAFDFRHMRRALREADLVVANTREAAAAYAGLGADPARLVTIPNGFAQEDFGEPLLPEEAVRDEPGPRFRLVHVGTLHSIDGKPGLTRNTFFRHRARRVDPLGRTGYYLLHALARLRDADPPSFEALRVDLYGWVHPSHSALLRSLDLEEKVVLHGYVGHPRALRALRTADAIFVPLHGVPPGERALVVPGKLYEALASGRPVLAALPPGDGADLVRHVRGGVAVSPTDPAAMAGALSRLVRDKVSGVPSTPADRARLAPYDRRALTASLAERLHGLLGRVPSPPVPIPRAVPS